MAPEILYGNVYNFLVSAELNIAYEEKLRKELLEVNELKDFFTEDKVDHFGLLKYDGEYNSLVNRFLKIYFKIHCDEIDKKDEEKYTMLIFHLFGLENISLVLKRIEILLKNGFDPNFVVGDDIDCISFLFLTSRDQKYSTHKYEIFDLMIKYGYTIKPNLIKALYSNRRFDKNSRDDSLDLFFIVKAINKNHVEIKREIKNLEKYGNDFLREFIRIYERFHGDL